MSEKSRRKVLEVFYTLVQALECSGDRSRWCEAELAELRTVIKEVEWTCLQEQ